MHGPIVTGPYLWVNDGGTGTSLYEEDRRELPEDTRALKRVALPPSGRRSFTSSPVVSSRRAVSIALLPT